MRSTYNVVCVCVCVCVCAPVCVCVCVCVHVAMCVPYSSFMICFKVESTLEQIT